MMRIEENSSNHTCHSYTVVLVVQGAHIPASPYMSSSTRKFGHLLGTFWSPFSRVSWSISQSQKLTKIWMQSTMSLVPTPVSDNRLSNVGDGRVLAIRLPDLFVGRFDAMTFVDKM